MWKRNFVRCAVSLLTVIAVCGLTHPCAMAADSGPIAAGMATFAHPEGVTYFALTLKPTETAPTAGPRDVVILFNTSAGQMGDYRVKGLEALKGLLAGLPANDRVQLMAIDLNAVGLTKNFVAPGSKEMTEAVAALNARVPLGATDMEAALNTVASSLPGEAKSPRAVVYIGDGRSAANLLGTEKFEKLVQKLVDLRIPVSSYIIGAGVDRQLPGALAVQTGGTVIVDKDALSGAEAGRQLAAAAAATVWWPTAAVWPAEMTEVFPKRTPPLRSDRETVVIGTLKGKGPLSAQVTVQGVGGPKQLSVTVQPSPSDDVNHYLIPLVEMARADDGITLPLVGAASLAEARQEITTGARSLCKLAQQALAVGNLNGAEKLVGEVLHRDPNDTEALAIKSALAKRRSSAPPPSGGGASGVSGGGAATLPTPPAPAAAGVPAAAGNDLNLVGPDAGEPPPGAMAEGYQHDRRIIAQIVQAEVQNTLNQARSLMGTDPDAATQQLKLTLEKVRQTAELNPDVRDQYVVLLQAGLREAARRKLDVEHARHQRLENAAAAKERMLIAENLTRNQDKLKQLMERFNSLMQEGRYRPAEEVATEAQKVLPDNPVSAQAVAYNNFVGNYRTIMENRVKREKGVFDVLLQVEKSFIPFPDEPPIVYPDAEVWQQLTTRRKEKYSSMDLAKEGPSEKAIHDALKQPTQMEFAETPLNDAIEYLKDYHHIEIQLDTKALSDAGITPDTPVSRVLKGITLRSALKLMLRDLQLTYIIQNEVLWITTPEEAENRLSTRVYPVADLVIPVKMPPMGGGMMGGMGGMGGGMGGMGGGMGGMGGGMGGMGGMGGGMGGMGGGMGMFNVPQNLLPLLPKVPVGGFQAFAVKDDLTPNTAATPGRAADRAVPSKTGSPALIENRPATIDLEISKDAKPETFWDEYFSKNRPQPAAVREAARRLMKQQKFDHVIALINAALRCRQGQPWMYEALALVLDAAGRPKAEIERAIMSAVDFAATPGDLMYVGAYLARIELYGRALQIYRQAAALDPLRPEPYVLGLRAARAIGDLDGLKWASVGILSQAWPKEHADVWQAGVGVAKEVLDKLRAEKRTKEADEFQTVLDEAVARDCVAIVTWTGEGDVDLLVEEPSGTVCSLRSPRTTAGGMLLGDAIAQADRDSYGGHSEVYVCPKGFDGTYRIIFSPVYMGVGEQRRVRASLFQIGSFLHYAADSCRICRRRFLVHGQSW